MYTREELRPRKIPRQARARATYDALVQATARILVEEGYEAASTNRIAERAGTSIGSLYQYFPTKESLVLAVVERHGRAVVDQLGGAFLRALSLPVPEAVAVLIRALVEAHEVDPALQRVIVQQVLHLGVEHSADLHGNATRVVEAFLKMRASEVVVEDHHTAAWVLVSTVMATLHGGHLGVAADVTPEAVERELTSLVVRYLTGASR
jgi:AcrR family transcriptional regulator